MNALFERFVWRVLETICARRGLRVHYQRKDRSVLWDESRGRSYASVIPDLLVDRPASDDSALAIDAKYKQYDERKLSSDDIYQTFLYAFAYGLRPSGTAQPPQSFIIYPASQQKPLAAVLQVRGQGNRVLGKVRAVGVHVPTLLGEVQRGGEGDISAALGSYIGEGLQADQPGMPPI